jgi:hypothetical protein
MKATYYGVWYEYYTDGSQKSGIIPGEKVKRPKEAVRRSNQICTGYEYWVATNAIAEKLKSDIDKAVKNERDMSNFYIGFASAAA